MVHRSLSYWVVLFIGSVHSVHGNVYVGTILRAFGVTFCASHFGVYCTCPPLHLVLGSLRMSSLSASNPAVGAYYI